MNTETTHIDKPESVETTPEDRKERSLLHACLCANVADEYRGKDVVVLDLSQVTPIVDFFVLATGANRRQMHAIVEETDRILKGKGSDRIGREGYDGTNWILQDYGDVVLHVFSAEARELYDLEHLWADAKRVDWQEELRRLK